MSLGNRAVDMMLENSGIDDVADYAAERSYAERNYTGSYWSRPPAKVDILLDDMEERLDAQHEQMNEISHRVAEVDHYPAHDLGPSPTPKAKVHVDHPTYDYMGREIAAEEDSPLYDFAISVWVWWEIFRICYLPRVSETTRYHFILCVLTSMMITGIGIPLYFFMWGPWYTIRVTQLERQSNEVKQQHIRESFQYNNPDPTLMHDIQYDIDHHIPFSLGHGSGSYGHGGSRPFSGGRGHGGF